MLLSPSSLAETILFAMNIKSLNKTIGLNVAHSIVGIDIAFRLISVVKTALVESTTMLPTCEDHNQAEVYGLCLFPSSSMDGK